MKLNSSKNYEIEIENGIVTEKGLPEGFVITDSNVMKNYGDLIGENVFVIDAGEEGKSFENYKKIAESMGEVKRIIAFGGGVVGDLAGFLAATYKRGIEFIQVPTTLLAMVDSSIGGKNGINLGEKKNYLGTIYHPKKILIDPLFLETLPINEFRSGVAEIIKYGSVFGKPNLERLEKGVNPEDSDLKEIIFDSCKIKTEVVEKDEYDRDFRHTLNFGHTIGHAIELLYGLSHGEAISIGMVKELELGKKIGIVSKDKFEKITKIIENNKLPTKIPDSNDTEKILELINYDKKGSFVFALDKENYNLEIDAKLVREVLKWKSKK